MLKAKAFELTSDSVATLRIVSTSEKLSLFSHALIFDGLIRGTR